MIILRSRLFSKGRKKRKRLDSQEIAKTVNAEILNHTTRSDKTGDAIVEDDLSKRDNDIIYHPDRKLKDEEKLTSSDKKKIRKAVKKGQMYIEFE